jgi:hypothetical protein
MGCLALGSNSPPLGKKGGNDEVQDGRTVHLKSAATEAEREAVIRTRMKAEERTCSFIRILYQCGTQMYKAGQKNN